MNKGLAIVSGAGLGAGLMYLLDLEEGRSRRAMLRDKAIHYRNEFTRMLGSNSRRIRNRAMGMVRDAQGRFADMQTGMSGEAAQG